MVKAAQLADADRRIVELLSSAGNKLLPVSAAGALAWRGRAWRRLA